MNNHRPVKDQVDALASEVGLLAAGTEPRRQAEIEAGDTPRTDGERLFAVAMQLRRIAVSQN